MKFKKKMNIVDFSTDLLTYLMPSDKHNSRTAWAKDLISSLINVALSWDVPFYQPQELQCLYHGATFEPLWSPILSSQPRKVMICGRHVMASVRDIKIAEALLIRCLAYYVCYETSSTLLKLRRYGFHVKRYGARISWAYSLYFL